MKSTSNDLEKMLQNKPVNDAEKLQKQQEYYKRLVKTGTAIKQTYSLKPISAI
jgi:hypothetical protein